MVLKSSEERGDRTIHLESSDHLPESDPLRAVVNLKFLDTKYYPPVEREKITQGSYVVVPLVFTRRIAAQSGRFLYCPQLDHPSKRLDTCITKHEFNSTPNSNQIPSESYTLNEETKKYLANDPGIKNQDYVPWERLICYPIDHTASPRNSEKFKSMKEEMLHQLEFRGYHAGKLFPDLSGRARYLNQGFK